MNSKKFLIVADIHGSMIGLDRTLELANELNVDKIIILGDTFGVGAREMVKKLNQVANKLEIVKGNNDWYYEPENADFVFLEYAYVNLNGTIAYACHGHRLDDMNLGKYNAKVIMQGHVHRPFIEKRDGVIRFCPGSISSPRHGSEKTFAVVENKKITIYNLDFEIFDEIEIMWCKIIKDFQKNTKIFFITIYKVEILGYNKCINIKTMYNNYK